MNRKEGNEADGQSHHMSWESDTTDWALTALQFARWISFGSLRLFQTWTRSEEFTDRLRRSKKTIIVTEDNEGLCIIMCVRNWDQLPLAFAGNMSLIESGREICFSSVKIVLVLWSQGPSMRRGIICFNTTWLCHEGKSETLQMWYNAHHHSNNARRPSGFRAANTSQTPKSLSQSMSLIRGRLLAILLHETKLQSTELIAAEPTYSNWNSTFNKTTPMKAWSRLSSTTSSLSKQRLRFWMAMAGDAALIELASRWMLSLRPAEKARLQTGVGSWNYQQDYWDSYQIELYSTSYLRNQYFWHCFAIFQKNNITVSLDNLDDVSDGTNKIVLWTSLLLHSHLLNACSSLVFWDMQSADTPLLFSHTWIDVDVLDWNPHSSIFRLDKESVNLPQQEQEDEQRSGKVELEESLDIEIWSSDRVQSDVELCNQGDNADKEADIRTVYTARCSVWEFIQGSTLISPEQISKSHFDFAASSHTRLYGIGCVPKQWLRRWKELRDLTRPTTSRRYLHHSLPSWWMQEGRRWVGE